MDDEMISVLTQFWVQLWKNLINLSLLEWFSTCYFLTLFLQIGDK